jgi:hypothetical protein
MRSKDQSQPARLFLRLAGSDGAIEIASGSEAALERLRTRLTDDFAGHPREPLEAQLARHDSAAA